MFFEFVNDVLFVCSNWLFWDMKDLGKFVMNFFKEIIILFVYYVV